MKFNHFLITRFNTPIFSTPQKKWAGRIVKKSKECSLNEQWLLERMEFFDRYCAPSVHAQTCQGFTWYVLCHRSTPETVLRRFDRWDKAKVYLGEGPDFRDASYAMWGDVRQSDPDEKPWVISTGLDADDAISTNYIETVQSLFRKKREFINIGPGYVMGHHIGYQYIGGRDSSYVNHFRSFVERRDNIYSVYSMYHGRSKDLARVRHVEGSEATWLEVIHGDNLSNRFKKRRMDRTEPFERIAHLFGLEPKDFANKYEIDRKGYIRDPRWETPKQERRGGVDGE